RYTPFDVDALQDIACKSVDAGNCIAFTKIAEGSCNKIFLPQFDNASHAIVRIPSSIIGNTYLSTCSEVATMQFVHEELESHYAPKVPAWNSSSLNPAVSHFIGSFSKPETCTSRRMSASSYRIDHYI
ncbi:hypothetical protein EV421DRAFT_1719645, partial [Armillaria borealis]